MPDFWCKPAAKSEGDVLQETGAQWVEEASYRREHYPTFIGMFICCALGVPFFLWIGPYYPGLALIGLAMCIIAGIMSAVYVLQGLPQRSVIFHRDGSITVPQKLPHDKYLTKLKTVQPELNSIEVADAPGARYHSVKLVTKDGRTITVSKRLHRNEAQRVVVELTLALKAMREATMGGPRVQMEDPDVIN